MRVTRNRKGMITFIDEALEAIGATIGDWVLIEGVREERPYTNCYHAAQVEHDGSGELDVEVGDEMDHLRVIDVKLIGDTRCANVNL